MLLKIIYNLLNRRGVVMKLTVLICTVCRGTGGNQDDCTKCNGVGHYRVVQKEEK
jgi:DnaJ-class molecular chaperone